MASGSGAPAVRLRRGVGARLFGGFWLQPILTMTVALVVVLQLALPIGFGVSDWAQVPVTVLFLAFWAVGLTAWAQADAQGVRWRYFRRYAVRWSEVDWVRFGSAVQAGANVASHEPAVYVRLHGVEHRVLPAFGIGSSRLEPFTTQLASLAAARGVQVSADDVGWGWLTDVPRTDRRPAGRIVSRSLARVRIQLAALAFVVVALCALAGSLFGYETHGVGARIGFGVLGVVFLLVAGLLMLSPRQ